MSKLIELVKWESVDVAAHAAFGSVSLSFGTVGTAAPVALITAGIHGDEGPWGARAIQKFLSETNADELIGTIRVVPVANPLAMEADKRNASLDTLDLNRVFPGDPLGSHTERVAAMLVEYALKDVDVVIDLHGGGSWCVNAFAFQFPGGEELATAFDAPFIVNGPDRDITLTGYARKRGSRVTAIEMGGRSEQEAFWANKIASGLQRALSRAGVLTSYADDAHDSNSIPVGKSHVLRPSRGGIFVPQLRAAAVGTVVEKDTVLGYLQDPITGETVETFCAPFERTALLLLRPAMAVLEGGAMTYVIAEPMQLPEG